MQTIRALINWTVTQTSARDSVTRHKGVVDTGPLRIAGRPIAAHLRALAPDLSRRVLARLLEELPVYATLPSEEVAGDIAEIVQHSVRMFADAVEARRVPEAAELAAQRLSAQRRAEEGVPLEAILAAYQLGIAMVWSQASAGATPDDHTDLREVLDLLLGVQRRILNAVTESYLAARRTIDTEEHSGRHALMAALLSGTEPDGTVQAAPRYAVLTLDLERHPDEDSAAPDVAARRKIRRVRDTLDAFAERPCLTAFRSDRGTVLMPLGDESGDPEHTALRALISEAAEVSGTPVTAAVATADASEVPTAVTRTAEIVDLVRATGRAPGLYRLEDVLLDYQLSRPSAALRALAERLAPLAGKPELLSTLQTYLDLHRDRRATAAALHVHPNTVDYRLRRISELTGLSAHRAEDLGELHASLVARQVSGGGTAGG
ncbi:helix-turn-helix domain-containing protein [Catenulispora sp. NF23]|uniref:PucR family transcriptional regulator n=1 Tax=Catenulispora pinistramenti TaxID=2705254 RepID=UPI001BAB4B4D|nr:helix-turn-helix domain-containing protein [Catenulispora pinistramenti]